MHLPIWVVIPLGFLLLISILVAAFFPMWKKYSRNSRLRRARLEKLEKENKNLREESFELMKSKENIIKEFHNFKSRIFSSGRGIEPTDLRMGDIFFYVNENENSSLFSVEDVKSCTINILNLETGKRQNVQYPLDAGIGKFFVVPTSVANEKIHYKLTVDSEDENL